MHDAPAGISDTEIINACINGDEKAWHGLVRKYKRLVYSIPIKWGIPPEDATDIFQAVWLDCFQQLESLRNLERIQPWLIRVAVRKCHRFRQIHREREETTYGDEQPDFSSGDVPGDELIAGMEREQTFRDAITQLTPRCQQIIHYLFYEDPRPSYQMIAERMSMSDNSVGFTRERCLKRLRKILDESGYRP
jgi:RNA polymerase sigma factor (sigma-70 family)